MRRSSSRSVEREREEVGVRSPWQSAARCASTGDVVVVGRVDGEKEKVEAEVRVKGKRRKVRRKR
jgi:hypothetical protein